MNGPELCPQCGAYWGCDCALEATTPAPRRYLQMLEAGAIGVSAEDFLRLIELEKEAPFGSQPADLDAVTSRAMAVIELREERQ